MATVRAPSVTQSRISWFAAAPFIASLLVALPLIVVAAHLLFTPSDIAQQMLGIVMPRYLMTTFLLVIGVAICTTILGVIPAWLVVMCRFPGRRIFEWALVLPLAVPAYVLAYVYYELLASSGPIQETLRALTGLGPRDYWFPRISSTGGAIFVLSLALYPYVYLSARAAFIQQAGSIFEASRMLGSNAWSSFVRIMLPLARPAVVVGLSLVIMETLADFGAVTILGVQTFATGIFRAWFSMGDHVAASQLAMALLGFVFIALLLERTSRSQAGFYNDGTHGAHLPPIRPQGWKRWIAVGICLLPLLLGFILPACRLFYLALASGYGFGAKNMWEVTSTSIMLAVVTSLIAMALALLIVYANRLQPRRPGLFATRIASLGYALPGPVIAVGTLLPLAWLDNQFNNAAQHYFGISTGLLLTGTWVALIFGYLARFMTISIGNIEAGFGKIKTSLDDVAASLGSGPMRRLLDVHIPLLWPAIGAGTLLILVDVMKELPMTMVLRPFDLNTLAITIYDLVRDERLAEAATPALVLVLIGLVPVYLISRNMRRTAKRAKN